MASNEINILEQLRQYCSNLSELDDFTRQNGIDQNHPDVIERIAELLAPTISDTDTNHLLRSMCSTTEELDEYITDNGLDVNEKHIKHRRS